VKHDGRRHSEGHEVGERVQLAAERLARARAAGDGAVDRIQHSGDRDGDRRPAHVAVNAEHDRDEPGAEAAAGDRIGQAEEPLHSVASAPW